jgi:hypothetical protein
VDFELALMATSQAVCKCGATYEWAEFHSAAGKPTTVPGVHNLVAAELMFTYAHKLKSSLLGKGRDVSCKSFDANRQSDPGDRQATFQARQWLP